METRNNTGLVVVVTLLVVAVAGLAGFIVYDKVLKEETPVNSGNNNVQQGENNAEDDKNEVKEIDINDQLVTSLKYPKFEHSRQRLDLSGNRVYKNVNLVDMTRDELMILASYETKQLEFGDEELKNYPDYCLDSCAVYSADSIESNFKKLFGPDVDYYNGNLSTMGCGEISDYDKEKKLYFASYACGGGPDAGVEYINKPYKAEQSDDYLYVYEYVQIIKTEYDYETDKEYLYLTNKDDKILVKTTFPITKYDEIRKLIDEIQLETYKWTFKKQSDGNYYFYSGAWEN